MKLGKRIIDCYRKLFTNRKALGINRFLFFLSLRGMGVLNYESFHLSGEEYLLNRKLNKIIDKNNPVFFDVGANIGEYSRLLLNTFPSARVFAFEPHPKHFEKLKIHQSKNMKVYNFGFHATEKTHAVLYDKKCKPNKEGTGMASVFYHNKFNNSDFVEYQVSLSTIDAFIRKHGIEKIDFLKIDTEGNEFNVLQGARESMENKLIKCIQFEFNEMNIHSRIFMNDFNKLLQNFNLYRMLPNGLLSFNNLKTSEAEIFAYQNIFAQLKE